MQEFKVLFCYLIYILHFFSLYEGYGFVDFESPAAAQKAVAALVNRGIQAQMAKVLMQTI